MQCYQNTDDTLQAQVTIKGEINALNILPIHGIELTLIKSHPLFYSAEEHFS